MELKYLCFEILPCIASKGLGLDLEGYGVDHSLPQHVDLEVANIHELRNTSATTTPL